MNPSIVEKRFQILSILVFLTIVLMYHFEITIYLLNGKFFHNKNVKNSELSDYNSKCFVNKIEYTNKHAIDLHAKVNNHTEFTCKGAGEIAPNNHIIQIEENVPDQYDGLTRLETYIFRLKEKRLKDIYDFITSEVRCYMNMISKIEGLSEGSDNSLKMDYKKIEFKKDDNYEITVKNHGHYYVECKNQTNSSFYREVFTILPRNMDRLIDDKKKIYKIVDDATKDSRKKTDKLFEKCDRQSDRTKDKEPLNILFIFIDSFSHNHAKRMIPETYHYLKSFEQDNQIFENYMIIGENTKPNMFPLLTGKLISAMHDKNLTNEDPGIQYNKLPLFWKDFEKLGHVSMYNEDFLINGLFLMGKSGFQYSPAHHYNYPYWQKDRSFKHWSNRKCYNGKFEHTVYIDQIKSFIDRMNLKENRKKGYVSVNMWGALPHGQFEFPKACDRELKSYLEESDKKGIFSNTAIIILSDHGGRPYAYTQKVFDDFAGLEYPFPFLSIRLPRSMRNSEFSKNFMNNKNKMITAIDIRKTLKHLYFIAKNGVDQNEKNTECRKIFEKSEVKLAPLRGISLLENLPKDRSCSDSLIPLNFCFCKLRKTINKNEFLNQTGLDIKLSIDFFMEELVSKTKHLRTICQEFKLKEIKEIYKVELQGKKLYELIITVMPGDSVFKLIIDIRNKKMAIGSDMTRENKYGEQSNCLKESDRHLKGFCFCNR